MNSIQYTSIDKMLPYIPYNIGLVIHTLHLV